MFHRNGATSVSCPHRLGNVRRFKWEEMVTSIPILLAACLFGDPQPQPVSELASLADPPLASAASPLVDLSDYTGFTRPPDFVPSAPLAAGSS